MPKHSVIVGNIGTVVDDGTWKEASDAFSEYRRQSRDNQGRAAGEDVTWFRDEEIYQEYTGSLSKEAAKEEDDGN